MFIKLSINREAGTVLDFNTCADGCEKLWRCRFSSTLWWTIDAACDHRDKLKMVIHEHFSSSFHNSSDFKNNLIFLFSPLTNLWWPKLLQVAKLRFGFLYYAIRKKRKKERNLTAAPRGDLTIAQILLLLVRWSFCWEDYDSDNNCCYFSSIHSLGLPLSQ